jgi:hypothetical protein
MSTRDRGIDPQIYDEVFEVLQLLEMSGKKEFRPSDITNIIKDRNPVLHKRYIDKEVRRTLQAIAMDVKDPKAMGPDLWPRDKNVFIPVSVDPYDLGHVSRQIPDTPLRLRYSGFEKTPRIDNNLTLGLGQN